jgi:hypothetical protein
MVEPVPGSLSPWSAAWDRQGRHRALLLRSTTLLVAPLGGALIARSGCAPSGHDQTPEGGEVALGVGLADVEARSAIRWLISGSWAAGAGPSAPLAWSITAPVVRSAAWRVP